MQGESTPSEALHAFITEEMRNGSTPGLAIAVVQEGSVVFQRGYGVADHDTRRPMTEHTGVVIGSTTKALTCTALLQLAESGTLSLDDTIRRHYPEFKLVDEDVAARMTIRQVMTHSAGLPPTAADNGRFLFNDYAEDDATAVYLEDLASTRLIAPPGSTWLYANDGFSIAGRIIELLTGGTYEDYVTRNILRPLGMTESAFSNNLPSGLDLATAHDYDGDGLPYTSFFPHNRAGAAAGSTLVMSALDAGRWLQAILDGGRAGNRRLLSEQSFAELVRPQVAIPNSVRGSGGDDTWYALGWMCGMVNGIAAFSHGGSTITMGSHFIAAPEARTAVAVVTNSGTLVSETVAQAALSLYCGRAPAHRFPAIDRGFMPDRAHWPSFAGTYVPQIPQNSVPGPLPITYEDGRLFATTYPGDARRRPGNIYAYPVSETDFVLFGRGRTGSTARIARKGETVEAVWQGVPLTKLH